MKNNISWAALGLILVAGGILRFSGLNWDGGYHLQPDERYISMALSALKPPRSWGEYLDPNRSPLSPYINNFGAYIYGQLPLTVLTYLSRLVGMNGYDKTYLLGRGISAIMDTLSIVLVYKLGKRLWNCRVGVIGAAFYAFAPLPIQYSHFMMMESWMTFSWLLAILILTRLPRDVPDGTSLAMTGIAGVGLGTALAVKLSSVVLIPLIVIVMIIALFSFKDSPCRTAGRILLIIFVAILSFRFFQPTIFASVSWLDWSLRQDFYQAFNFQRLAIEGKVMFPPQWQWVGTTRWWFPLKNMVLWGMGPAAGGLAAAGVIWQIWRIRQIRSAFALRASAGKRISLIRLILAVWLAAVFVWQGGKFVKNMRYFLPFFPLYVLFAASVVVSLKRTVLARTVLFVSILSAGLWAIMFTNIYRLPTTRVAASEWIYENIPEGSKIMLEEWDDPLPLQIPGYETVKYQTEMVGVYGPDDDKKKDQINRWTGDFDWIVLSSPRAKGSIGKLPKEFPQMSKFYRDLDNGSLGFVKAAEFISYPKLDCSLFFAHCSLLIDDSSAEESFWVYDHPKVEIYKRTENREQ